MPPDFKLTFLLKSMSDESNSVIVWYEMLWRTIVRTLSHLLLDSGSDENFFRIYVRSGRFSLRLCYMAAVLVLLCLQESCCYDAILSMRALRPRFHATFGFFLNRRIVSCFTFLCLYGRHKTKIFFLFL